MLRFHRGPDTFELVVPRTEESFRLGDSFSTRAYFERIGMADLGGRALDAARSFGAAQALVKEQRAFGLDLTKVDKGVRMQDQQLMRRRLLGAGDDEDDGDWTLIL